MKTEDRTYWNDLLRKYGEGSISSEERFALEKRALDDTFLMDALEGYATNEGQHVANIERIKQALDGKTKQKRGIGWYSIAAGFALLAAISFLLHQELNEDHTGDKALVYSTEESSDTTTSDFKELAYAEEEAPTLTNQKVQEAPAENVQKKVLQAPINQPAESIGAAPVIEENESSELPLDAKEKTDKETPLKTEDAATEKNNTATVANTSGNNSVQRTASVKSKRKADSNLEEYMDNNPAAIAMDDDLVAVDAYQVRTIEVVGTVMDENGEPLIGANVQSANGKNGSTTDFDGKYKIEIVDTNETLLFTLVGYESKMEKIGSRNEINIQLKVGESLAEVVVMNEAENPKTSTASGYKSSNFRSTDVYPEMGWEAFEKFIEENKQRDIGSKGFVKVSFMVSKSGVLDEFEVIQSATKALDTEAIRLIKAGGKWVNNRSASPTKAEYSIQF